MAPGVIRAFDTLEKTIGGRDALVSSLLTHTLTPDEVYLVGLLADPTNTRKNLAMVCAQGGVSLGAVFQLFQSAVKTRALVLATVEVAAQLPAVTRGVMEDAQAGERPCPRCQGAGAVTPNPTTAQPNPTPETCRHCQGKGTFIYEPPVRLREIALELGGMLNTGPQVTINQTKNSIGVVAVGAYDQLVAGLDDVIYGDPRAGAIDAQVEEASDATDTAAGVPPGGDPDGSDALAGGGSGLRSGPADRGPEPLADDPPAGRGSPDARSLPGTSADGPPRLMRPLPPPHTPGAHP